MTSVLIPKPIGLVVAILLLGPFTGLGQILKGTVRDVETQEPLRYATVSIIGQNQRAVARSNGAFAWDVSRASATDSVTISYVGYRTVAYALRDLDITADQRFLLHPLVFAIEPVTVTARERKTKAIGFTKLSGLRTGWGDFSSNRGRMRGVVIREVDCSNTIKSFTFRIRNNDWDSVAFRLELLSFKDGKPGASLLPETIIVHTDAKNKWVTVDLGHYGIAHCGDVLATLEWVDAWGTTGEYSNVLTLGLGRGEGKVLTKEAGQYEEKLLEGEPPPAMYIEVFQDE